ncbi:MAG: response regulator [Myxococcota bacterium]
MRDAHTTIAGVEAAVAALRGDAVQAGNTAMLADLDRVSTAAASLSALVAALPDRAVTDPDALRTIRHDLRTPVGQIHGYCELLQEEAEDAGETRFTAGLATLKTAADALRLAIEAVSGHFAGPASDDTGVRRVAHGVSGPRAGSLPGQTRGTVLVVDDNADNRALLARRLQRDGYAALLAEHGAQALQMAASHPVDVVLLDVMMPVMDGYETLARFKADSDLLHIPVIMLTSLDDQGSLTACIEAGAEDHLPKPFDPVLLRARLSGSLERKRARDLEREYLGRIVAEKKRADDLIHGVIPIGVALSGERDEARILERTLQEARRFCGADGGSLLLVDRGDMFVVQLQCESMNRSLAPTATRPPTPSGGVPQRVKLKDTRSERRPEVIAAVTGETVSLDLTDGASEYDLSSVRAFDRANRYTTRSVIFVPLRATAGSDVCGVLQLWNATRPTDGQTVPFSAAAVEMLQSLSSLAAAALGAYRRERELRQRIRRLEIKIDEKERHTEVAQITETDYFKQLRAKAQALRKGSG